MDETSAGVPKRFSNNVFHCVVKARRNAHEAGIDPRITSDVVLRISIGRECARTVADNNYSRSTSAI